MEIYLIRHTTLCIESGVCYGQSDIPLSNNFNEECENIIEFLPSKFDAVYSSPLQRCITLAEKIINTADNSMIFKTDERLKEMNFGKWEMKQWENIEKNTFYHWANDIVNFKIPDGESFFELYKRVNSFIDELLSTKDKTVIIITHAGVIRCFLSRFNKISLKEILKNPVEYSSVNVLSVTV